MTIEYRYSEIRADNESAEQGIFEGYFVKWGDIDSYQSTFKKGAFSKTLRQRKNKIKVLWNHDSDYPIGKPIEIYEDDTGVFARVQLITDVEKGKEVYNLIKNGIIDALSFGFTVPKGKQKYVDDVREISEVILYEISPVTFPANENAKIMAVRNEDEKMEESANYDVETETQESDEKRQIDFDKEKLIHMLGAVMNTLYSTLSDVWYSSNNDKMAELTVILDKFKTAYLEIAEQLIMANETGQRAIPVSAVEYKLLEELEKRNTDLRGLAADTSFTYAELQDLRQGKQVQNPGRLKEVSEELHNLYQETRKAKLDETLREIRDSGLSYREEMQIRNNISEPVDFIAISKSLDDLFKIF